MAEWRERLNLRINRFIKQGVSHINIPEDEDISSVQFPQTHEELDIVERFEDEDEDDNNEEILVGDEDEMKAENMILPLPSSFSRDTLSAWGVAHLADQERELRIGQANDALELLRDALATKALVFRTKVRNANSQIKITRSWADIEKVNIRIRRYVGTYRRAHAALIRLQLPENELARFKIITNADLKMSSDIVEENRVGQRNDNMAWFWRLGDQSQDGGDWMEECETIFNMVHFHDL
jgi:hypothetical protein